MLVNEFPDRTIVVEGTEYLYFGGTSYLGMASNNDFQALLSKNIQKWGSFYGSSRSANVQLSIYDEFEKYFSDFVKFEASLSVSSGTLAGKLVIETLSNDENVFFHYPKTHPAILGNKSEPLFVNGCLNTKIRTSQHRRIIITADAMASGEVTPTSFEFLENIPNTTEVTLVIDESHTLGITGSNGEGISRFINHENLNRKIMISSFGKALGLAGGVISSDAAFIKNLKNTPTFTSASGASPAYLNTFLESTKIYNNQRIRLDENLSFIEKHLQKSKEFKFNSKYPVIYIDNDVIFTKLLEQGIVITSFKYPTYKKRMNRVVITSNHTKEDLTILINLLNDDK